MPWRPIMHTRGPAARVCLQAERRLPDDRRGQAEVRLQAWYQDLQLSSMRPRASLRTGRRLWDQRLPLLAVVPGPPRKDARPSGTGTDGPMDIDVEESSKERFVVARKSGLLSGRKTLVVEARAATFDGDSLPLTAIETVRAETELHHAVLIMSDAGRAGRDEVC